MKKIIYAIFVISLCIFCIACNGPQSPIEAEVIFDYSSNNDLSIMTKNVEAIDAVIYDEQELSVDLYKFLNSKIYIENIFLKELGYGEYDFQVKVDGSKYDVKVYICDSREPKLLTDDLYKYQDKDISIPYTNYNATFELVFDGKLMTEYTIEEDQLIISKQFIELCKVDHKLS